MIDVAEFGGVGDGLTDDTTAFVAALAAIDARVSVRTGRRLGGVIDCRGREFLLSAPLLLHRSTTLLLDGATLFFAAGGLVLDSQYTQAESCVEIRGGRVASLYGGVGFAALGGGYSTITGVVFTGWAECVVLEGSNGVRLRDCGFSTWPGEGAQFGVGVRFAFLPALGGGCTNGNRVESAQFNGCSTAVVCEDGADNAVSGNANGCGEVARVTGCISLDLAVNAEGVTGDTYCRLGAPGGYPAGRIVAQRLRISGEWSRNEPHAPSCLRMERNASVRELDLSRLSVLAPPSSAHPVIACADPWPAIPYVMIEGLTRAGFRVGGTAPTTLRPTVTDRDLWGRDRGA